MSFATLKTGIDGLDGILGGGIRYPDDGAAFVCLAGGPGTGKTLLALELIVRAWLDGADGATFLYYSVEHTPESIHKKLASDFDWFRSGARIATQPREVPGKQVLLAESPHGTTKLVTTQARPASMQQKSARGTTIDIEWILAEIENHRLVDPVQLVVIDNVGLLLTDLEYFEKRAALLEVRRRLLESRIHGIFVMEEAHPRDLRLPSAEEFSTDLMIHLSFREEATDFKARAIEISKARHQYYYRGVHHFSIAGRGITRDVYLGARNERGPGIHIYPSVAAQLSMARDQAQFTVPARGDHAIDLGHPDLDAAFLRDTGPALRSSTVLLAEPGTRATFLALRFLAAGLRQGERVLFVSTREDRDAIRRICQREPVLRDVCLGPDGRFAPDFRVVYLHPEFIAPGKFTWDLMRLCQGGHDRGQPRPVARMAFDNLFRLQDRFPLIVEQRFLIAAMLDMLRYEGITPLFVDMVPPGTNGGGSDFDPSPYLVGFDNVLHLYFARQGNDQAPRFRVLKSVGNDYHTDDRPIDWRRS
ncbi:MAG: AAA family ATPase [Planctomycetes bacterium]|nr:AAA family ATPase [Planctomycetota bacterium]